MPPALRRREPMGFIRGASPILKMESRGRQGAGKSATTSRAHALRAIVTPAGIISSPLSPPFENFS